jgi:hydrogenase maturation protease
VRAARATVTGVGNAWRRDDGVGPAVVALLAEHPPSDVLLTTCDGDPARLIEIWSQANLAVVVDSLVCDSPEPGRIHRIVLAGNLPANPQQGTHGIGIPEAAELAAALGLAPDRFVVLAVEVSDVGHGHGLTDEVAASLAELERLVRAEITLHPVPGP